MVVDTDPVQLLHVYSEVRLLGGKQVPQDANARHCNARVHKIGRQGIDNKDLLQMSIQVP